MSAVISLDCHQWPSLDLGHCVIVVTYKILINSIISEFWGWEHDYQQDCDLPWHGLQSHHNQVTVPVPSQIVNTNLTPSVATFNIRLLTNIISISPGPSPTYLDSSQCNAGNTSQLAKCGNRVRTFLIFPNIIIYNKIWNFILLNICNLFCNVGTFI